MCTYRTTSTRRQGGVAPLVALLLVPLMGMLAFSVDVGYMIVVRTELQNAADAAALAGAQQLMDPMVAFYTPGNVLIQTTILSNAVTIAKQTAKEVSKKNAAGKVSIALLDADIDVG